MIDYTTFLGPGDRDLHRSEIQGYQPVSRIGEIVINAFVDPCLYTDLGDGQRPQFHEWATVQPGMICVAKKNNYNVYGSFIAAETAAPVTVCSPPPSVATPSSPEKNNEEKYFFAGVARSKSVRSASDGNGPDTDEYFTMALGGMVSILNTSGTAIANGDTIVWSFDKPQKAGQRPQTYHRLPQRVAIKKLVDDKDKPRIIGRALSFAKPGEPFDMLIKQ